MGDETAFLRIWFAVGGQLAELRTIISGDVNQNRRISVISIAIFGGYHKVHRGEEKKQTKESMIKMLIFTWA